MRARAKPRMVALWPSGETSTDRIVGPSPTHELGVGVGVCERVGVIVGVLVAVGVGVNVADRVTVSASRRPGMRTPVSNRSNAALAIMLRPIPRDHRRCKLGETLPATHSVHSIG